MICFILCAVDPEPLVEFFTDYQMDLLRALEMSRLQFLQEMGSLRPGSGDRCVFIRHSAIFSDLFAVKTKTVMICTL